MRAIKITSNLAHYGCTGSITVADTVSGETLCSITAVGGLRSRNMSSSYDRHRAAKEGGLSTLHIEGYEVFGDVQAVIDGIKASLPACFHESGFAKQFDFSRSRDGWEVFNFFRTLGEQGGWYGNTPAPLVRKIKNAWKKGVTLAV